MHYVLRHYKDNRSESVRRDFQLQISALLTRFLLTHGDCLRDIGGDWDAITTVPSSRAGPDAREGDHPLVLAIRRSPFLAEQYQPLLRLGGVQVAHNHASDSGYEAEGDFPGRRVLLLDDTFTSGAHSQSAASALRVAGADLVAIVPVGRYVVPDYNEANRELWERAREETYDFGRCCLT